MFLKPSQFFSIAETSQNKEEAAKFLDWFTNSVECNNILLAERGIPVNSDVAEAIKPNVDENSQKVFDYIAEVSKIATPIDDPDPSGKGEVEAQAKTIVENLRYGDTDAAGAAEEFVTTSQKILRSKTVITNCNQRAPGSHPASGGSRALVIETAEGEEK